MASTAATVAKRAGVLGLAVIVGWTANTQLNGNDDDAGVRSFERPTEPPPEYLYLDTARVLAYLGQIEDGLTSNEKRTLALTNSSSFKAGPTGAEGSASAQRVGSVSQDVTAGATDRFYKLLGALQEGGKKHRKLPWSTTTKWLWDVDATHNREAFDKANAAMKDFSVGDFVRIRHAAMYLPTYAQLYPRTSYAASYLGGGLEEPLQPLYAPKSHATTKAIVSYRRTVGKNPRMAFVLPVYADPKGPVITFVLPVRYRGLTNESSSLSGEVTVVGKVIYREGDRHGRSWVDRRMVRDFAPALQHADDRLLRLLRLDQVKRDARIATVRDNMTFTPPVVVILPVAIYQ